ncbi:MAG TPA: RIP metalloprotease RseP [Blastocatellia bacterium]
MSNYITMGVAAVVVLGAMVIIHEFGHFIVAKLFRIRVEVFSIGFGKRLLGFRRGDTDYRLSLVPLGGYVKLAGEMGEEETMAPPAYHAAQKVVENSIGMSRGEADSPGPAGGADQGATLGKPSSDSVRAYDVSAEFRSKPRWQRLCVLFAGPAMNILTALMIPAILAMVHYEVPEYFNRPAVIGDVRAKSAGEEAGLMPGDLIVKVGDKDNPTWGDFSDRVGLSPDITLPLTVKRGDETKQIDLKPTAEKVDQQKIGTSGLVPALGPNAKLVVKGIEQGSPAEAAGLQPGDQLVAFNGTKLQQDYEGRSDLIQGIENSGGKQISITVNRGGQTLDITGLPRLTGGSYRFGFFTGADDDTVATRLPVLAAFRFSYRSNIQVLDLTAVALGQVIRRQRSARDTIAGPIQILKYSGEAAKEGIAPLFSLMALLSLNLGIFNLLPIPVLDGGTIFMILLESVLGLVGLSLTVKVKERVQTVGLVLLMVLMAFVIINDISKVIPTGPKDPQQVEQPAAPNK